MTLTPEQAETQARQLHEQTDAEKGRLDEVRRFWKDCQRFPAVIPSTASAEVRILARLARVNMIDLVVESLSQSLSVVGYRAGTDPVDASAWDIWQANKLDARQSIIHRAAVAYGVAYAVVTPGEPVPVIRGVGPRKLTTLYDGASDWPTYALERVPGGPWRLYDESAVYRLTFDESGTFRHVATSEHGAEVTPIVRYLEVQDPDWDDEPTDESDGASRYLGRQVIGQVAPLMTLQDQVNLITFNLLVAQHFAAHRQRYILGWLAPDEQARVKMGSSTLMTFEDGPEDVKVGDLEATKLDGYLDSREGTIRQMASLSQTPTHELIGEMVNLSAEALAAAESGRDRKVADRQVTLGEAHEQTLALAARLAGQSVPDDAQVRWRDTSARSLAATVDALVKLVQVGMPLEEAIERVPDMDQQDVDRIKSAVRARPAVLIGDQQGTSGVA
jgi:hypothetical protein